MDVMTLRMEDSLLANHTGEILKLLWFTTQVRNEDDVVTMRLWLIPEELGHLWGTEGTSALHLVPVITNELQGKLIFIHPSPVLEAV